MEKELYTHMLEEANNHFWYRARKKILFSLLDFYFSKKKNIKRNILVIGCGMGGNLEFLSKFGNLTIIEKEDIAYYHIKNNYSHFCVHQGELPDKIPDEIQNKKFDLIVLLDVLEHIEDDEGAFRSILQFCSKGSLLLITVPAYNFLYSSHDEEHHHYRRYSMNTLKALVHKFTFVEIIKQSYFNTLLFPIVFLERMWDKLFFERKEKKRNLALHLPSLLNKVFYYIFVVEKYLLPYFFLPYGCSCLLLLKISEDDPR